MGIKFIPDQEILNKIKDMAQDGCTISQIAAWTNKSRGCIKNLLINYNISLAPSSKNKMGKIYMEQKQDNKIKRTI